MPAHLWDRAGEFRAGEQSNRDSVAAGDRFARSGALEEGIVCGDVISNVLCKARINPFLY